MSYRIDIQPPKHHIHREVTKLSTPAPVHMDNGETFRAAYPAGYYVPPKHYHGCKHRHLTCIYWVNRYNSCTWYKNISWNPTCCDKCQSHINERYIRPIHFRKELKDGETIELKVNFEKDKNGNLVLPGLTAEAWIDEEPKDNIIRVNFTADCQSAQTEKQQTRYSLILNYKNGDAIIGTVVLKGKVIVYPTIL